jgi:hypothetical protein
MLGVLVKWLPVDAYMKCLRMTHNVNATQDNNPAGWKAGASGGVREAKAGRKGDRRTSRS